MGDPASQASGRNGGNFELFPENFLGPYEGLVRERYKYLEAAYPNLDEQTLATQARRQAGLILEFGKRNSARFDRIVTEEGIQCDYSPHGWLRIAETAEEEAALRGEVALVGDEALLVHWSKEKIFQELGLRSYFGGRCAPKSGNYHPHKFVSGVLEKALERGVGLYTQSRQYVDGQGVPRGMLHVGGGLDRPAPSPEDLQRSPTVLGLVKAGSDRRFPDTRGQPPSRVWTGPMAFTPDRMPVIGFLRRSGADPRSLIVAAGFNGYGGSYCVEAGYTAVEMARTGEVLPEVPEEDFSPHRLLEQEPLFPVPAPA